jgi:Gas vesicle protein G
MKLLLKLLILPVTGPLETALWTTRKIAERAEEVYYDDAPVRAALLELELRMDLGEIDEETFEAEETVLLARLEEIRNCKLHKLEETYNERP